MSNVFISESAQWKRPCTGQRYLQGPYAEEVVSMWCDGKFVFEPVNTSENPYWFVGSAFKFLLGEEYKELDFKKVKYRTDKEGIPVHGFYHKVGDLKIDMEACTSVERSPIAYVKVTLSNLGKEMIENKLAIIARSGNLRKIMGVETDSYAHLNTNIGNWGFIPTDFVYANNAIYDENVTIKLKGIEKMNPVWQGNVKGRPWHQRGLLDLTVSLKVGEQKVFYVAFYRTGKHNVVDFDYKKEERNTRAFWMNELSKIHTYPKNNKKKYYTMVRSLVANSLQMFAMPIDADFVVPRQGGNQTYIWGQEALYMFKALDRIGDFSDYSQKVFDSFYLGELYVAEGEDKGSYLKYKNNGGTAWATNTSGIMESLAWHAYYKTQAEFDKYKDYIYETFSWLARQREKTKNDEFPGYGLFPPKKSCDWGEVYQTWTKTDAWMLKSCRAIVKVFEKYNDPRAKEVRETYEDYLACARKIFDAVVEKYSKDDELVIPMHVGREIQDPQQEGPYIHDGIIIVSCGICPLDSPYVDEIRNYYHNRCLTKNGLHGLMNDGLIPWHQWDPWAGHVWYTGFVEQDWFEVYMRRGEYAEAKETLDASLKYSMTKEFYCVERYADNDPYFTPWTPNASCNGRIIDMMYDYYETMEK